MCMCVYVPIHIHVTIYTLNFKIEIHNLYFIIWKWYEKRTLLENFKYLEIKNTFTIFSHYF